jgi:hypothetical protein
MEFEKVCFTGILNCGAYIYGAEVYVRKGYGMGELVRAIKAAGYKAFMLDTMRVMVKV